MPNLLSMKIQEIYIQCSDCLGVSFIGFTTSNEIYINILEIDTHKEIRKFEWFINNVNTY